MATDTPADAGTETNEQNGGGLFDDYVQSAPPELRPYAEDMAKQFSSRVDGKLREAAEFRKQWEPFGEVEGLTDMDPETLSNLVQFAQLDDDGFKEWLNTAVQSAMSDEELGWSLDEETWAQMGRANGWIDGDEEEGEGFEDGASVDEIAQKVAEMIAPQLKPLQDHIQSQAQQQGIQQAESEMREQLDAVKAEAGERWNDKVQQRVLQLAKTHIDEDDPIAAAWADYQEIAGTAQGDLLDDKSGQQTTALNGGAVDTTPPEMSWHGQNNPKDAARQRFAAR